ncbi:interleukin-27 subunit beta [Pelobates cultripes]|uniref:Interleukin-27 subunit beta n=1 Tax=Pelobates cultripes TaxID=61616 RepID=A0AAD1S4S0_PELCU|nr:interleukin-27 subunit beta [Pelobates cultripes]
MLWKISVWILLVLSQVGILESEDPPGKLGVQCWTISYPEKIRCTWDFKPNAYLPTTFITTYRMGLMSSEPPKLCVQSDQEPQSCLITDFQMFADYPYILNVTAISPLGGTTQLFPFIVEDIIRPDPPENVTLSNIVGEKKKLLLHWYPPRSWLYPEQFPLMYKIRYKRAGAKHYKTIGPYDFTSFILKGLKPGSFVEAQVAAKDFTDYGNYSEWSLVATGKPR